MIFQSLAKLIIGPTGKAMEVNSNGEAKVAVSAVPTEPPAGKATVKLSASGNVSGNSDTIYVIPNAKNIEIVFFKGGSEAGPDGAKTVLYYAPNGTVDGSAEIIDFAYTNGTTSAASNPGLSYAGNGTRAIILRRTNLGGGVLEITALTIGFVDL